MLHPLPCSRRHARRPAPGKAHALASLAATAALTGLLACSSAPAGPEPNPDAFSRTLRGAPIRLVRSPELDRIRELEEARSTGGGELLRLARDGSPEVRRRAVVALGRLPFPEFGKEVTEALVLRLEDPDTRQAAAFALGQRADPASAGVLTAYMNDPDPGFRSRVVEAASKLVDDPALREAVTIALRDADLGVRIEAAVGTSRWSSEDPDAADVDRALLDTLSPYRITSSRGGAPTRVQRTAIEAELVWRVLFALARRGSTLGEGAFLEYASSDVPLEQLFAMRGIAKLEASDELVAAAAHALDTTSDWRVACEAAVALGRLGQSAAVPPLARATDHASAHVRAAAAEALGNFAEDSKEALKALHRGRADVSPVVRNAALASFCRLAAPSDALAELRRQADRNDPIERFGAAAAAAAVPGSEVVELLSRLANDPSKLVATRAVSSLGEHLSIDGEGAAVRALLRSLLESPDNGVRSAAVEGLASVPDASDVEALIAAANTSKGDISEEIVVGVLRALGKIPESAEAREFVRRSLVDPRPFVRRVAHRVAEEDFGLELAYTEVPPDPARPPVPLPGRDFPAWTRNPLVAINTNRGEMVFELFPAEAPVHVVNFLALAEKGEYDGTLFHRVVPDFVVQGGDYRGDGYGGRPARGVALRSEFTPRKYTRGSLGMPRNQDPDSGGSQLFVTHRPTPHLDGHYTIFGELRAGGDVLDRIEQGDRILGVRLLSPSNAGTGKSLPPGR